MLLKSKQTVTKLGQIHRYLVWLNPVKAPLKPVWFPLIPTNLNR